MGRALIKNNKIITCFLLIFSAVFLLGFFGETFSQGRPLEVIYPNGPERVSVGIVNYFIYIFRLIIIITGLVALGVLIAGGVRVLVSTGRPEKLKEAREQVAAGILGIIVLLASYLILYTIDPQLVIISMPQLVEEPYERLKIDLGVPYIVTAWGRIKDISENLKEVASDISREAQEIRKLTEECECVNVISVCLCQDYLHGSCEGIYCRLERKYSHPCPDWTYIEEHQQKIVALKNEAVYYKNRIEAEREDLLFNIEEIKKRIEYYEKRIEQEEREHLKEHLRETKQYLERELNNKTRAANLLNELMAKLIPELRDLIFELAEEQESLIDSCWQRINEECEPECCGGCHDEKGCFPEECSGGNPCEIGKIQDRVNKIRARTSQINRICNEIISIIDGSGFAGLQTAPLTKHQ